MSAYDTIDLRPSWGGASLLSFVATLLFLVFVGSVARVYRGFHFWSAVLWLVLPTLAILGCLFALQGLRRRGRRTSTVVGLVLNGTVLGSCCVALLWP